MTTNQNVTRFLLSACRLDPKRDIDFELSKLPDNFDWEVLIKTALDHGVTALLCHNLRLANPDLLPADIFLAAGEFLNHQDEENQKQVDQLLTILKELKNIDVPAVPFKGMTLALRAYGKLNLRNSRDLDILIRKKDISICLEKFQEIGYANERNLSPRQWQEFINYTCEEILFGPGVPVEPHWAFTPATLAINIDYDAIWERCDSFQFYNHAGLKLSDEDELIVLCLHGCKEEWGKLKWVVDLSEFIRAHPKLIWGDIINCATKHHICRIIKLSLLLVQHMLEAQLPGKVNCWIKSDPTAKKLAIKVANEYFTKDKSELDIWKPGYFHWAMRERSRDRILYLLLTLTQPRVQYFADINIPDRLFLLYWPYRLLHDLIALPIWKIIKKLLTSVLKGRTG